MLEIFITYGIPASGKDTWALEQMRKYPNKYKRITKDLLREMIDGTSHSFENEKFILNIRDKIIEKALRDGKSVIVSDTNFPFGGKHFQRICEIAQLVGDVQVIEKFFDVDVKECIKRNSLRDRKVPEDVIHNMFNKHVKGKPYDFKTYYFPPIQKVPYNQDLPDCVIFDIDGTLAHKGNRSAYDWKRVGEDTADENIKRLNSIFDWYSYSVANLNGTDENDDVKIFIFTGRDGVCLEETKQWLLANDIMYDDIFIRPAGNMEKDSVIKKRMYEEHIKDKYNVVAIFDDRLQVCQMWRSLGLTVCQVDWGDF